MSLVALKKKSNAMHNKISRNKGFSLNGTRRIPSSSWVGGSHSYIGSNNRVRFRGLEPVGYGGCCGKYSGTYSNSGKSCSNDTSIIKPSVKNTKGKLTNSLVWLNNANMNTVQVLQDNDDYEMYYQKKVASSSCGTDNTVVGDAGMCSSTSNGSCSTTGNNNVPQNMRSGIKRNLHLQNYVKTTAPTSQSDYLKTNKLSNSKLNTACDNETELFTTNYVCKP